jgi:hypothetical protein
MATSAAVIWIDRERAESVELVRSLHHEATVLLERWRAGGEQPIDGATVAKLHEQADVAHQVALSATIAASPKYKLRQRFGAALNRISWADRAWTLARAIVAATVYAFTFFSTTWAPGTAEAKTAARRGIKAGRVARGVEVTGAAGAGTGAGLGTGANGRRRGRPGRRRQ